MRFENTLRDLCFDFECTTYNKGSPFDKRNLPVCVAITDGRTTSVLRCDDHGARVLQERVNDAERLVGFNLKFDLHWLRRIGVSFEGKRVYDVQAAEFVLSGQTHKYPSLNDVGFKYTGESKVDEVAALWDSGVQTTDIPWSTLAKYAAQDVALTYAAARKQQDQATPAQLKLISLVNQDLLVLEEMEWNGIRFNRDKALEKAEVLQKKIDELQSKHKILHNVENFNWGSTEHLSALLYGGTIKEKARVPVGHFKSGKQAGQIKYGWVIREHNMPRLFKPPKGSALKKEGFYSTDDDTLASLEGGNAELLADLKIIRKLDKEISTYLLGFPKRQDEGHYTDYIYGNFNQCVAATGRLSSTNPNLQNLSEEIGRCLVSRFSDYS